MFETIKTVPAMGFIRRIDHLCYLLPLVVRILVLHLIQTSFTQSLFFVGKFHYRDFESFLESEQRCDFLPSHLSNNIQRRTSVEKESCLIFMTQVIDSSSRSRITKVETKYFAFGAKYSFVNKNKPCYDHSFQKVEIILICEGPTEVNGTTCEQGCKIGKQVCRQSIDVKEEFCIWERNYQESCEDNLPCSRNLECKLFGNKKTCQCKQGYEAVEERCLKAELPLGEICEDDIQCSRSLNFSRCSYNAIKERRVCSCFKGYVAISNQCYKGGLDLHEYCQSTEQCTGTGNAKCAYIGNNTQAECRCNDDHIEINSKCYKKNRRLDESCERSEQCTGSSEATECKSFEGVKICSCKDNSIVFSGVCLESGFSLDEPCSVDGQCFGAKNTAVCMATQNETESLTCKCSQGFLRYRESCVKENKQLFEECEIDDQCNRTSSVCREIRERKVCMCKDGFKADIKHLECFKETVLRTRASGHANHYVVTSVCVAIGLGILMVCSIVILLYAMNRRGRKTKRIIKNQNTSDLSALENDNFLEENGGVNLNQKKQEYNLFEPTEDMYNEADQLGESGSKTVYDFSKPQCANKEESYDQRVMYSHLHEKPLQMCENEYDLQSSIVDSTSTYNDH